MALQHARPGEPIDLRPLGSGLAEASTRALIKTQSLELIRVVLRMGEAQPRHSVYGESTIHCIEGRIAVEVQGATTELGAGELLLLTARCEHSLEALADSSVLLTVQTPPGLPGSGSSTL